MPDYQKAKIYKLINDEMPDKVYYGSTTKRLLSERLASHKYDAINRHDSSSSPLFEYGKVKIFLVEDFPCETIDQLAKRERFYIENNECVNIRFPGRSDKELRNTEIVCVCGAKGKKGNIARHLKSKKHQKWVNSQN